ncbi:SGNH/GDSL hydrolase family protein [Histidinibacterium lentulum]|uniref:Lipolytic enzyme, G-D-S-L n=1 Tax=Histidinibacterium lentulum TaxID=2480588 RepID=A0A3N2R5W5_9RHOB|nr:SGNH/GDSL hydrolase family protein [Histidinibacterium lentulum]ROU02880.1 lipolytic enzyme, G-D-S-L [Histidinibacterium lentulum]
MPVLLAFGDSNTHGTLPMSGRGDLGRLGPADRWPGVCAAALGPDWTVIEEGLPGRTSQFEDPVMGVHMNGRTGLRIALDCHRPLDVLVIMLGTNDLKSRFQPGVGRIAAGLAGLLDMALSDETQEKHDGLRVLLVCPPPVREVGALRGEFLGAEEAAQGLAEQLDRLASGRGCGFLDAGGVIEVSEVDGIHFGAEAHGRLGRAIAEAVQRL